jgi:hypothetical protein
MVLDLDTFDDRTMRSRGITWEVQRFANSLFSYLHEHNLCQHLKCLVLGHYGHPAGDLVEGESEIFSVPRHCFIIGYQTDSLALGRKTVIAVPVPAYMLRELEPKCDLLDFDPGCDWVGSLPGRFQEV